MNCIANPKIDEEMLKFTEQLSELPDDIKTPSKMLFRAVASKAIHDSILKNEHKTIQNMLSIVFNREIIFSEENMSCNEADALQMYRVFSLLPENTQKTAAFYVARMLL